MAPNRLGLSFVCHLMKYVTLYKLCNSLCLTVSFFIYEIKIIMPTS